MENNVSQQTDVLLVEDSGALTRVYMEYLRPLDINVRQVSTGQDALDLLNQGGLGVVLLDIQLPDMSGLDILKHIQENDIPTSVVIITAHGSADIAKQSLDLGAVDFLEKPFSADRLRTTVNNVLDQRKLRSIVESFEIITRREYCGFIGSSMAMQSVYQMIESAAGSGASIFVTGESGTGKEVCAEAIHTKSKRRDKNFVALNCAAIPRDLIESEIFGHVKGAFTGAVTAREGAASRADGGTLFLDEIAEMDIDLQAKLLRFIQTGTFQKVGGSTTEKVDVRFVCATNRSPLAEVEAGRFREDLYYRLHVIPIELPPLRSRDADVLEIGQKFLQKFASEENKRFEGFDAQVSGIMMSYGWPGNVRELQNVVRNIVVLQDGELVETKHLPPALQKQQPDSSRAPRVTAPAVVAHNSAMVAHAASDTLGQIKPLWLVEREAIESAIDICDGNVPKAAAMLGVSPSTVYRKRQAWADAS